PRPRQRLTAYQKYAEHERVNLRRGATQGARLIVEGHCLGLSEIRRGQDRRDGERLDGVVRGIRHEPLRRLAELARDLRGVDVGAALGGDAEVGGEGLQAEAGQGTRSGVVELREDPRVDHVASGDLVAPIADRTLGDLKPRDPAAEALAAAPP